LKTNRKTLRHGVTGKHRTIWPTISLLLLLMMCVCAFCQELPKVVVLSTGGTIASKQDPVKGGYVPALSGEDLVAAVPAIKKIAQIQVEQISNIPSPEMTPEIWLRLAGRVNELLAKPEIVGIVVTHGTDTLEETAYFVDLTTGSTTLLLGFVLEAIKQEPGLAAITALLSIFLTIMVQRFAMLYRRVRNQKFQICKEIEVALAMKWKSHTPTSDLSPGAQTGWYWTATTIFISVWLCVAGRSIYLFYLYHCRH
jgi:hypothetical protein